MRYLVGIDMARGEGVLCTETGTVLRYVRQDGDIFTLWQNLTEKIPVSNRQTAVHIGAPDRADGYFCDETENAFRQKVGEKTKVLCEDRMVHRLYSCFPHGDAGIALYAYPDAGAGKICTEGLWIAGGFGAPFWSDGSSYLLGCQTIRAALGAADGTAPTTILTDMLEKAVGLPIEDVRNELQTASTEKIADYARLAIRGRKLGDAVSKALTDEMLSHLTAYVRTLSRGEAQEVKLIEVPEFLGAFLKTELQKTLGKAYTVSVSDAPLLLGSVRRAGELLRIECDTKFCRTFSETSQVVSQ